MSEIDSNRPLRNLLQALGVAGGDQRATGEIESVQNLVLQVDEYDPWPTFVWQVHLAAVAAQYTRAAFVANDRRVRNLMIHGKFEALAASKARWKYMQIGPLPQAHFNAVGFGDSVNGHGESTAQVATGASVPQFVTANEVDFSTQVTHLIPSFYTGIPGPGAEQRGLVFETDNVNIPLHIALTWQEMPNFS